MCLVVINEENFSYNMQVNQCPIRRGGSRTRSPVAPRIRCGQGSSIYMILLIPAPCPWWMPPSGGRRARLGQPCIVQRTRRTNTYTYTCGHMMEEPTITPPPASPHRPEREQSTHKRTHAYVSWVWSPSIVIAL